MQYAVAMTLADAALPACPRAGRSRFDSTPRQRTFSSPVPDTVQELVDLAAAGRPVPASR